MKTLVGVVCSVVIACIFVPAVVGQKVDPIKVLKRLDRNGDGVVNMMEEVPEQLRGVIRRLGEKNGQRDTSTIEIDQVKGHIEGAAKRKKWLAGKGSSESEVPGFGEVIDLPEVPGFGEAGQHVVMPLEDLYDRRVIDYVQGIFKQYDTNRNGQLERQEWKDVRWQSNPNESDTNQDGILTRHEFCERIVKRWGGRGRKERRESSSSYSKKSPSTSTSSSANERTRKYAKSLIAQNDTNKNGVLESTEYSKMRGSWSEADTNGDGQLSESEVTNKLAQYGKSKSSSSSSKSSSRWKSRSRSTPTVSRSPLDGKKSYRFLTPTERLPKGLPPWFVRDDANGDGQVMMAEFSTVWTQSKANEFREHDVNGDGVITATEATAKQ